uniref:Uncharacterized protein n=1 Tax=Siphoviridae sp. ctMYJ33 TaxID=2825461 RepID=A0A8S5P9F6_9CAUD|nr:MAG TPA: hypothetical protein [Siphoviridae sp. ctMYJ33]
MKTSIIHNLFSFVIMITQKVEKINTNCKKSIDMTKK